MEEIRFSKNVLINFLMIFAGTALMAVSSVVFMDPSGLVPGGFTGVAIIVRRLTLGLVQGGLPLWVTNVILNVPMLPLLAFTRGKRFLGRTLEGFLSFTFWLAVFPALDLGLEGDMFLLTLFGGALMGVGMSMVFLAGGTTGGTDMGGAILQHFFPHLSMAFLMQALDVVIIFCGIFVFGLRMSLYSLLVAYLTAKVSDLVIDGLKFSKMLLIVSDHAIVIANTVMESMNRGVTSLNGRGMYTGERKDVLMCVLSSKEIPQVKAIVRKEDPSAFIIVTDVREVNGEGFREYNQ